MSDILAANLVNVHLIIFGALFIVVVLVLPGGMIEIAARMKRRFIRPLIEKRALRRTENEQAEPTVSG